MGYINDENDFMHTKYSQSAKPAIGFKQLGADFDMDNKKIFRLNTQADVAIDADLDTYALDLSSGVNKGYVKRQCLTKDAKGNDFDLGQCNIFNSEPFYIGLYNDTSLPNVEYVRLEDNKVKAELNNKLADKADLSTNDEQTFNSIINVPNFDQGYSNMSNVMNKEYIDSRDALKADKTYADNTFLTKKTGAILANTLQSKASKIYADSTFLTKAVGNGLAQNIQNRLNIHGSNMMQANLDMGGYNITHLKNPTNDTDAVNKKYMLDHVDSSHITSVGQENTFAHIMTDSINQLSEEDDIELGSLIDHPNSYHKINTKVVDSKLVLDSNKGYYSSRLGINVYSLPINRYTMVFELFFPAEIDHDSLDIDIVSSIDNIDKSTTRVYDGYSRTIAQINKYQQHPNNYLYVDIVLKMKSGNAYVSKLQTYIVIYGIKGYQSNVDPRIYDQLYYVENDRIAFNASIDMKTKAIYGIKPATTNDQAVNYEQLKNFRDNLKSDLELKMHKKRNNSYYHKIFEYFYDLTDPSEFIMADANGAVIQGLNNGLVFFQSKMLADFDPKNDFHSQSQLIIGGDFNVHLDAEMDNEGGRVEKKDSVKNISDIKLEYDLVDIWRVRNPDKRQFTWRQKRPRVQRRLDYWLINDGLQDFIEHAEIIPSIKSDHSAITLQINTIEDKVRGPSHWVFNSSLLEDDSYIDLICSSLKVWLKEFEDIHDKQLLWDLVKYRIRQTTISFSKEKAKERRNRLDVVESKLKESEQLCAIHPTEENIESLEKYKMEYDSIYDYITQGNIIRSKAAWYEKGEKNNKFFLNLEKSRKAKTCIRKLINKEGQEIINSKAIMFELKDFYKNLYDDKDQEISFDELHNYTRNLNTPKLSDHQQLLCEGQLTYDECYKVVDQLKNNKSPGNDGLTAEFYKQFWPILGGLLVDSLNAAYVNGRLSNSQRQAIIRLIEKKDKDRRHIENWRPISLLNVDYKIGSKALATRLEKVLPHIIHANQCAYVKGRTIFDAIRSINDVMEYTKIYNIPGLMTTFDFKKAFDSLNWQYLFNTLETFNFGDSFIRWVKVLYSDISSCVMNNGFASDLFEIKRGVRQGDPLSPYLFIIALEVLNIAIRQNKEIEGIKVGNEEVKLTVFADDLTTFVKNTRSFFSLKEAINKFGFVSGLKLNEEKTEAYWLGSLHNYPEDLDLGTDKVNKPIKILD
ncbi:hypothetical protein ACROYT_G028283 [Oculina patagonica]